MNFAKIMDTGVSLLIIIFLTGCGGAPSISENAQLKLKISNTQKGEALPQKAVVKSYRVTISGDWIDLPITAEFGADASFGVIENIPTGTNRDVLVWALNSENKPVRIGEKGDVSIDGGENVIDIKLNKVPLFLNIRDGGVLDNTRLKFDVFAEAGDQLVVEDSAGANKNELYADTSTGVGSISAPNSAEGAHTFIVRDLENGMSSSVNVTLLNGAKRKGAPFFSAMQGTLRQIGSLGGVVNGIAR